MIVLKVTEDMIFSCLIHAAWLRDAGYMVKTWNESQLWVTPRFGQPVQMDIVGDITLPKGVTEYRIWNCDQDNVVEEATQWYFSE